MKKTSKFLWIIALVVIIGFSFNACDSDSDGGNDIDADLVNKPGEAWVLQQEAEIGIKIGLIFKSNGSYNALVDNGNGWQIMTNNATFKTIGNTLTLHIPQGGVVQTSTFKYSISSNKNTLTTTITIEGAGNSITQDSTYTRMNITLAE